MVISRHDPTITHHIHMPPFWASISLKFSLNTLHKQDQINPNIFPMRFNVTLYFHNIISEHYSNHHYAVSVAAAISHISENRDFCGFTTRRHFTSISFLDIILPSYTHCIQKWFPANYFAGIHRVHISI